MSLLDELNTVKNVIIIGSGPAAHTAAIYAARAKLSPIMFEGEYAGGVAAGGQLTTTTDVENFPGFPKGIMGPELMFAMREQSINCGTKIYTKTVDSVDFSERPYKVTGGFGDVYAHVIIIATGATAKRLYITGEDNYWQKGISACAVCDGALPIFRDKPLVVIGGGDSAVEEATYLTKFASKVTMLVRKDHLRASKVMQERAFKNEKIEILWNTEAEEVTGEALMTAVKIKNNQTNDVSTIDANGLFYAIGHEPNTAFLNNQLTLDDTGYIVTENNSMKTSIDGVYACGDVQDKIYRQAITAAGTGCMAALEAERYLTEEGII
ncbi:MAG: thioredoxin-disulfide reductase [Candidatus Margulisiibacteriota bacterium]|nr:thioredoxin-disulfide reductase [Candidatus Margulisiibacteriota bacterium]